MNFDIYTSTKSWQFTHLDEVAEEKFSILEEQTRSKAPENFYHSNIFFNQSKPSPIYNLYRAVLSIHFYKPSPKVYCIISTLIAHKTISS